MVYYNKYLSLWFIYNDNFYWQEYKFIIQTLNNSQWSLLKSSRDISGNKLKKNSTGARYLQNLICWQQFTKIGLFMIKKKSGKDNLSMLRWENDEDINKSIQT